MIFVLVSFLCLSSLVFLTTSRGFDLVVLCLSDLPPELNVSCAFIDPVRGRPGNSENKRQRKPTKRLLESAEEYEQIFIPKRKSKKNASEPSVLVRCCPVLWFPRSVRERQYISLS